MKLCEGRWPAVSFNAAGAHLDLQFMPPDRESREKAETLGVRMSRWLTQDPETAPSGCQRACLDHFRDFAVARIFPW